MDARTGRNPHTHTHTKRQIETHTVTMKMCASYAQVPFEELTFTQVCNASVKGSKVPLLYWGVRMVCIHYAPVPAQTRD